MPFQQERLKGEKISAIFAIMPLDCRMDVITSNRYIE